MSLPLTEPAFVFVVLFAVILIAPIAAERAKVPGIIGLIVAGTVVGPNGLGLIERDGAIAVLGGIGLLYLMFQGGLELDLEDFEEHRRDSILYGMSTFIVPMIVNTAVALALGFSWLAALLIASAFTSHTPIAYPVVQRLGLLRNRAVIATMGGTLLAVTAALLVLAVVAALHRGDAGLAFWAGFILSLAAFLAFSLLVVPRITRWFFAGLGQDRNVRFTFVLVTLFGVASLADVAGIEAIVGAFLAGLALNRFIAPGSVLMQRVQFLGASLLVPLFLVSTGMLIDPGVLVADVRIVGVGLALSAAALAAKWLAAWPVAVFLDFDSPERWVIFSLSAGQAAGALAAVIVGAEIGLLDQRTVNSTILVLLVTCLAAAATASRFAPRVAVPERKLGRLGETVVVPVANPASAGSLVKMAALLAGPDSGSVIPVNVLSFDATPQQVDERRKVTTEAEQVALANGAEAQALVRIDASPTAGVLHTVVESHATSLLIGWKGYANAREHLFGGVIDAILARSPVPVLVCRAGSDTSVERIVLSVTLGDLSPAGLPGLQIATQVAERMARQAEVPILVVTETDDPKISGLLAEARKAEVVHDERKPAISLRQRIAAGDVVIVGTPPVRAGLGQTAARVARALPQRTVIAVVPRLS